MSLQSCLSLQIWTAPTSPMVYFHFIAWGFFLTKPQRWPAKALLSIFLTCHTEKHSSLLHVFCPKESKASFRAHPGPPWAPLGSIVLLGEPQAALPRAGLRRTAGTRVGRNRDRVGELRCLRRKVPFLLEIPTSGNPLFKGEQKGASDGLCRLRVCATRGAAGRAPGAGCCCGTCLGTAGFAQPRPLAAAGYTPCIARPTAPSS